MRMVAARAAGDNRYSTTAEESVIAPPKPAIVWKLREGSTTTVGTVGVARVKLTVPMSVNLYLPSAVVSQTCAALSAEERLAASELPTADAPTPAAESPESANKEQPGAT